MPANWYAKKDATISGILEALANDLTRLFESGVTCEAGGDLKNPITNCLNQKYHSINLAGLRPTGKWRNGHLVRWVHCLQG